MAPKIGIILSYFFQLLDRAEVCKILVPYDFAKKFLKEIAFRALTDDQSKRSFFRNSFRAIWDWKNKSILR